MHNADELRAVLDRVRSGELSPEIAAAMLIQQHAGRDTAHDAIEKHAPATSGALATSEGKSSAPEPSVSMRELIERLGPPPSDLVEAWRTDWAATRQVHANPQPTDGNPHHDDALSIPEVWDERELDRWFVTPTGQLRPVPDQNPAPYVDAEALTDQLATVTHVEPDVDKSFGLETDGVVASDQTKSTSTDRRLKPPKRKRLVLMTTCIAMGGMLLAAIFAVQFPEDDPSSQQSHQTSDALPNQTMNPTNGTATGDRPVVINRKLTTEAGTLDGPASEASLETLETDDVLNPSDSLDMASIAMANVPEIELAPQLLEVNAAPAEIPAETPGETSGVAETEPLVSMPELDAKAVLRMLGESQLQAGVPVSGDVSRRDVLGEEMGETPDEAPQDIRSLDERAIGLPEFASSDAVELPLAMETMRLEFPWNVAMLLSESNDAGRQVIATQTSVPIAQVSRRDASTTFRWLDSASSVPVANSMVHGRFVSDDAAAKVYLRPTVEAKPLPFDFATSDSQPTWDLRHPLPPVQSDLQIEFALPEHVETGWIEPLDESSPRRTRGIVVFTPEEEETVAIGLRLDVRCSRKLSIRMRYAARLDPNLPWEPLSQGVLESSIKWLGDQVLASSQQLTQIQAVYSDADSDQRRVMRGQRDAAKNRAAQMQLLFERASALQDLVARLADGGEIRVSVGVQWPDERQLILRSPASEGE